MNCQKWSLMLSTTQGVRTCFYFPQATDISAYATFASHLNSQTTLSKLKRRPSLRARISLPRSSNRLEKLNLRRQATTTYSLEITFRCIFGTYEILNSPSKLWMWPTISRRSSAMSTKMSASLISLIFRSHLILDRSWRAATTATLTSWTFRGT